MPTYTHYEKGVKNTPAKYMKQHEAPAHNHNYCTSIFIKPRTGYDEMMKDFINGKPLNLPNLEKRKSNWK